MPIETSCAMSRGLIQIDRRRLSSGNGCTLPMRTMYISMPYLSAYRLPSASPNTFDTP